MDIYKIVAIALITTIASVITKQIKPELSVCITIAGSVLLFFLIVDGFSQVFNFFNSITDKIGMDKQLFTILIKIIGVGYIGEFGANICQDSGNSSIADKVILASKIVILIISMPIFTTLFDIIVSILP